MISDQYYKFILRLCISENKTLNQIGNIFKCIFIENNNLKSEELLKRSDEINAGVKNFFPSRFAEEYELLNQKIVDFQFALESKLYENIEIEYKAMFSKLKNIWHMFLEFINFLLMLSVNRINKISILTIGKDEFEKAFSLYKTTFHENEEDFNEDNMGQLAIYLIQLFRKLYSQKVLCNEFILLPILKGEEGINTLFPPKIDSVILLFSILFDDNNSKIVTNSDEDIFKNISFLLNLTILDIVDIVMPIFKYYDFVYIISINLDDIPFRAKGISISGIGNPRPVQFRIKVDHQTDLSRFQKNNLFLINRKKQIGFQEIDSDIKQFLTPDDYMNLTPLMLYTTFRESLDNTQKCIEQNNELFVFYKYNIRNNNKFLKFLEFSGASFEEIIRSEKSGYCKLFDEYDIFSKNLLDYYIDIEKTIQKTFIGNNVIENTNVDIILEKTWKISIGHISSLLRVEEYDSEAKLKDNINVKERNIKFIEDIFVSPKEEKLLENFMESDSRGFIIVGKSGIGKSNLLCSFFLKQRRKKEFNIFIDARKMNNKNIKQFIKESFLERINENWNLKEFDNYLKSIQKTITIIIDGVNEYNNIGGSIGLLEEIIAFIEDNNIFQNVKIIASCRTETWNHYKDKIGYESNILNKNYFFTQSGDAIIISGFEGEVERELLYSAYQKYYILKPESYKLLPQSVKELIKQPFMMGLIADIYSNLSDKPSKLLKINKIPKKLDYFLLFELLTERKMIDAKRLLNESNIRRDNYEKQFEKCLFSFARILYYKIVDTTTSVRYYESDDKSDSLQIDQLDKNKDFSKFLDLVSPYNNTTIFSSIIQVGLIDKIYVDEYNYWGNKTIGRAFKFFHDQYTQFWLSAVYNENDILGKLCSSKLRSDTLSLDDIIQKIYSILEKSKNSPILFGALYHWLYNNFRNEKYDMSNFYIFLFNNMVEKKINIVNYFVGSFLHWMIDSNIISSSLLINQLIENGGVDLRKCFYEHIIHVWPDISPKTLQAILSKEKDETLIRGLSDIFVNLFIIEPQLVIVLLDKTLDNYDKISIEIIARSVIKIRKLIKTFTFTQMFITSSVLCNFSDSKKMKIIGNFLKKKYNMIFEIIIDKNSSGLKGLIREKIYRILEESGTYQWDIAICSQGRNNTFFIEDDGLIQREVLYDFYKYCVYFHNEDLEIFSLDINSEYMSMTLKMIEYRQASIIGYVATLILAGILRNRMEKFDEIIDTILESNSKSAKFFGFLLVYIIAISKNNLIEKLLDVIHKKFIPQIVNDFGKDEYAMTLFLSIGAIDFELHWKKCEIILSDIINQLSDKNNLTYIDNFGEILIGCIFQSDIKLGIKICDYLLDKGLHENQFWRDFTYKILAGMLSRSPNILKSILNAHMEKDITNEIRIFLTEGIIRDRSEISYQNSWNNFFILGLFSNKKLRYLLIKNFLSGLVQANCPKEFVREFRRLVVEGIKTFFSDDSDNKINYDKLTVEEGLSSTECVRRYELK